MGFQTFLMGTFTNYDANNVCCKNSPSAQMKKFLHFAPLAFARWLRFARALRGEIFSFERKVSPIRFLINIRIFHYLELFCAESVLTFVPFSRQDQEHLKLLALSKTSYGTIFFPPKKKPVDVYMLGLIPNNCL